jgi:glutamate synthase domain-containing protein 2/glutamate synthase domain-containing protein 1/glutamate synthase domain-containing protein 3
VTTHSIRGLPPAQGLYDPTFEHDACGIGFIAHLRGERSRGIVESAIELLRNLAHRSAVGGDAETGDGAGILLHVPHVLLRERCRAIDVALPDAGEYGVGMLFLPTDPAAQREAERIVERCTIDRGCRVLGWRDVPTVDDCLGADARRSRPTIRQVFIAPAALHRDADDAPEFERSLYIIRRGIERAARAAGIDGEPLLYVASLSSRTIVYKGLLRPEHLASFYVDLADPDAVSGLALVHSRFATNTFPSWPRAHPYRLLCHNGEINTLRGNLTWARVREEQLATARFGDSLAELLPVIQADQSDSASLDNLVELLMHAGRPLPHAMAMLIPKAWEQDAELGADRRAFYEYHASLCEPWDGPAAVAFTDGRQVGALLDRNGLRPARWIVTSDDRVVLASEAGALDVPADRIRAKGRLRPGTMLVVNTTQGRLLLDDDIQTELAERHPYARWLFEQRRLIAASAPMSHESHATLERLRLFGYTREETRVILAPMAASGDEPIGSMGNDAPIAPLSSRPQLLYSYFRQLFAQVTNPAIDPIRERVVMSLALPLGPIGNVLDEAREHARRIRVEHPVLDQPTMEAIRALDEPPLRAVTLPALFDAAAGPEGLEPAVATLCAAAERAISHGNSILVLSDRDASVSMAPIPSALAVSAVHHHLIRRKLRSRVSLVAESGDAREVSHIALLFGYGASAVYPYLALDACAALARDRIIEVSEDAARAHYIKAVEKGLLKILSKMGISTLQGYCGAQIWEAVGLGPELVMRHFPGTASRIGGIELRDVAEDVLRRAARDDRSAQLLPDHGEYHVRSGGEQHGWNPTTVVTLQRAARDGDPAAYRAFSRAVNDGELRDATLRGLLDFVDRAAVSMDDVEPASSIVRRFATGAMSFGSISAEAHEALALAMNQLGGRSNTGEGGEDPARFGTPRNSAIKQVASARFGVTTEYIASARELQIKIAQGAKPGEGGQLPGHKVDATIARVRHSTPGVALISPPPHHDIYSIEDLKQLIHDLRRVNPSATISVKLVAEAGVGTVAAGVAKAGADLIVISGDSGGTGASPLSSIKRAGVPWEIGLAETQQTLVLNGLRERVRVQVDGQLKTGRDVVTAALLGADEFGFATAPLVAQGCVMMRKCHLNICPVGIATQDPVLREKFTGRPGHLINYFFFVAGEAREHIARLGARSLEELIGRADLLRRRPSPHGSRASKLDLSALLYPASAPRDYAPRTQRTPEPDELVTSLLAIASPAIERRETVRALLPVRTADRAIGAEIAGEIARRYGHTGLPDDTIFLRLRGSAGQSFGAFAARGMSLELEGEANDYVAKGLSGGRIVVRPARGASVLTPVAPLVGNTSLYGATSGELFVAGGAGERFAVRNSGATAVVESVGDHACEYMTGGRVIILGPIGRNFAAGMSGGIVYVLDETRDPRRRLVPPEIDVEPIAGTEDERVVRQLLDRHARYTGSRTAKRLLARWADAARAFLRVIPIEYKRALAAGEEQDAAESEAPRYG